MMFLSIFCLIHTSAQIRVSFASGCSIPFFSPLCATQICRDHFNGKETHFIFHDFTVFNCSILTQVQFILLMKYSGLSSRVHQNQSIKLMEYLELHRQTLWHFSCHADAVICIISLPISLAHYMRIQWRPAWESHNLPSFSSPPQELSLQVTHTAAWETSEKVPCWEKQKMGWE